MDVSKTIEAKISNYFRKKATQYACSISSLSMVIQRPTPAFKEKYKNKIVEVDLYKDGKMFVWANLTEVLDLSLLELIMTNEDKISNILLDSIFKYEQQFNANAQIGIYSDLQCVVLANYKKQKQITINDII